MPARRPAFIIAVLLTLSFVSTQASHAQGIDEILPSGAKSDGCTLIPDGHIRDCCLRHDQEYFVGGTRKERRESDKRLYNCVRKKKGFVHKLVAPFIWLGVRIGGVPFLSTPFRWGFGIPKKSKRSAAPPGPEPELTCRP
jgi:hypothetical protein